MWTVKRCRCSRCFFSLAETCLYYCVNWERTMRNEAAISQLSSWSLFTVCPGNARQNAPCLFNTLLVIQVLSRYFVHLQPPGRGKTNSDEQRVFAAVAHYHRGLRSAWYLPLCILNVDILQGWKTFLFHTGDSLKYFQKS